METVLEGATARLAEVPLERLEAEICELAGHQAAAECRLLLMVAEFDRREGWGGWGIRSCAHWLSWRCGLGLVAAREKVRVARRLAEMPLVRDAFARGELSYSKVRALARVVTPATEEMLLEMAGHASTAQLEQIVRGYRRCSGAEELAESEERHQRCSVAWHWDDDGSLVVSARLDPEDGAAFVAALEAQRAAMASENDSAASPRPSMAEALGALARTALAQHEEGHGALPAVVVHVDAATLTGQAEEGRSHLADGPALPPETTRRLACDAVAVALTKDAAGNPLDIGRRSRIIPPALRRALWARDQCCRFPGCGARRYVDAHHVVHWAKGGRTALTNLILLCGRHHRLVHEGGYRLTSPAPHDFTFARPDGTTIPAAPTPPALTDPGLQERNRASGLSITSEPTGTLAGRNERYDLGLTIQAILQRAGLLAA